MTAGKYVLWFLLCSAAYALVFLIQIPLRRKGRYVLRIVLCIIKALLATAVAYLIMVVTSWFSMRGVYPTSALYVALCGDVISDLIMIPVSIIRKDKPYLRLNAIVCAFTTMAILLFGMFNMQSVRCTDVTYKSSKLTQEHKMVFISDVHFGSAQTEAGVEKTLKKIAGLNPDFIVLGGDITDNYTSIDEMQTIFRLLGSLDIPVYYIYGNHDRQSGLGVGNGSYYTEAELEKTIIDAGIIILKDSWVRISDDLVLLGKEDATIPNRLEPENLPARPDGVFVLSIDHSPFEYADIIATKADLQISGHSHAGQLFPLKTIYNLGGFNAYGKYHHGDTDVFVSSGFSGWGVPLRTEVRSEYVVVNLVPEK
ncbi:MAG: metallophosphoesterase [Spirochaetales bacterium]|nr:metallophosphoesterase [Spirochaetales bacterium]